MARELHRFLPAGVFALVLLAALMIWLGWSSGESPAPDIVTAPPKPALSPQAAMPAPMALEPASLEKPSPISAALPATPEEEIGVRLHRWLTSSTDLKKVADTLIDNFPSVKPEDQAQVVRELIPLVSDERYPPLGKLMLDPHLSFTAHRMLFLNLRLRSDRVELPMLLQLMRQGEAHPFARDAQIELHIRFGEDYGNDWGRWSARITQELAGR